MKEITAQEFQRNFAEAQDTALVEPLTITRHGKPRLVVMSVDTFKELRRAGRQTGLITDMPNDMFAGIMDSEPGDKPKGSGKKKKS